jgi:hypothetical protein
VLHDGMEPASRRHLVLYGPDMNRVVLGSGCKHTYSLAGILAAGTSRPNQQPAYSLWHRERATSWCGGKPRSASGSGSLDWTRILSCLAAGLLGRCPPELVPRRSERPASIGLQYVRLAMCRLYCAVLAGDRFGRTILVRRATTETWEFAVGALSSRRRVRHPVRVGQSAALPQGHVPDRN